MTQVIQEQNLYSIDNSTQSANDKTYIEAGIHENLTFTKVAYATTDKGKEYLTFEYTNGKGDKGTHTEWPFAKEVTENTLFIIERQKGIIKQIGEAILGKGNFIIKGTSFADMAKKVVALLSPAIENKFFRIKVVYDNRGFTSLSSDPKWTFIEPMSIPLEESKIRILKKDKMERPKQDYEPKVQNPFDFEESSKEEEVPTNSSISEYPF